MAKKSVKSAKQNTARAVDRVEAPTQSDTPGVLAEVDAPVTTAAAAHPTVTEPSSAAELLDDMTDPDYSAAYDRVFSPKQIPIPIQEVTKAEFQSFAKRRTREKIERAAFQLVGENRVFEIWRALERKLYLITRIVDAGSRKAQAIRTAHPNDFTPGSEVQGYARMKEAARAPGSPHSQVMDIDAIVDLLTARAYNFIKWLLDIELPLLTKTRVNPDDITRLLGIYSTNNRTVEDEIEGIRRTLERAYYNATRTTRATLSESERKTLRALLLSQQTDSAETQEPPTKSESRDLPVIYFEEKGKNAYLSAEGNLNLKVKLPRQQLDLLRAYFDPSTGCPLQTTPSALSVCQIIHYGKSRNGSGAWQNTSETETYAKRIVTTLFGKMRMAAKHQLEDEEKSAGALVELLKIGIDVGPRGAPNRQMKFRLLSLPEDRPRPVQS